MNTMHTPGPWHIGMRPGPMVYGTLGEQVADCRGLDEAGYNARLIAAAPEMLELLRGVLDAAKSKNHTWLVDIAPSFIEGLLAKIEGKA